MRGGECMYGAMEGSRGGLRCVSSVAKSLRAAVCTAVTAFAFLGWLAVDRYQDAACASRQHGVHLGSMKRDRVPRLHCGHWAQSTATRAGGNAWPAC
jgi:hypothetical protein